MDQLHRSRRPRLPGRRVDEDKQLLEQRSVLDRPLAAREGERFCQAGAARAVEEGGEDFRGGERRGDGVVVGEGEGGVVGGRVPAEGVEDGVGEGGGEGRGGEGVEGLLLGGSVDVDGVVGAERGGGRVTDLELQSVQVPDPVDKDLVLARQVRVRGEGVGGMRFLLREVFEEVVDEGVFLVVGRGAGDDAGKEGLEILVRVGRVELGCCRGSVVIIKVCLNGRTRMLYVPWSIPTAVSSRSKKSSFSCRRRCFWISWIVCSW